MNRRRYERIEQIERKHSNEGDENAHSKRRQTIVNEPSYRRDAPPRVSNGLLCLPHLLCPKKTLRHLAIRSDSAKARGARRLAKETRTSGPNSPGFQWEVRRIISPCGARTNSAARSAGKLAITPM